MSFKSLFGVPKKEELAIILDIGNASVGGALVFLSPDTAPSIVYSVRKDIPISLETSMGSLLSFLGAAVEDVLSVLQKQGMTHVALSTGAHISPHVAFCILAAPWYAPFILRTTLSQEQSFMVSPEVISALLNRELETHDDREVTAYIQAVIRGEGVSLIEKETIGLKVNGYEVGKPFHPKALELAASFYLSVVPEEILEVIQKKLDRFFHLEAVTFHSFTLALWSVVRDMFHTEEHFLLCDVTGEVTELSLIRGGSLRESTTIPLGRNFFIRNIMNLFQVSHHEASSLLNLYVRGKAESGMTESFDEMLEDSKKEWLRHVGASLNEFSGGMALPKRVFLTADEPLLHFLALALMNKEAESMLIQGGTFLVTPVNNEILSPFSRTTAMREDAFLSLGSLFAQKIHFLGQ